MTRTLLKCNGNRKSIIFLPKSCSGDGKRNPKSEITSINFCKLTVIMSQKANKTVLITGANRGIGLEFVKHYSNLGWKVLATTRSSSKDLSSLALNGGFIIEGTSIVVFSCNL